MKKGLTGVNEPLNQAELVLHEASGSTRRKGQHRGRRATLVLPFLVILAKGLVEWVKTGQGSKCQALRASPQKCLARHFIRVAASSSGQICELHLWKSSQHNDQE